MSPFFIATFEILTMLAGASLFGYLLGRSVGFKQGLDMHGTAWFSEWRRDEAATTPEPATKTVPTAEPVTPDSPAAPNNLRIVEGIGPKIEELLFSTGITTFKQLAETTPETLVSILRTAGFTMHNPTTWPQQALLAHEARWEELNVLQRELVAGIYKR
jgi:predicted flap endonuclease-1-like 5' DNA nuclease